MADAFIIGANTYYIVLRSCGLAPFGLGLAGLASRAGLAGRVSCLRSAGYVVRAGCVISALTDNC